MLKGMQIGVYGKKLRKIMHTENTENVLKSDMKIVLPFYIIKQSKTSGNGDVSEFKMQHK